MNARHVARGVNLMTVSVRLTEADLRRAVSVYLDVKGYSVKEGTEIAIKGTSTVGYWAEAECEEKQVPVK